MMKYVVALALALVSMGAQAQLANAVSAAQAASQAGAVGISAGNTVEVPVTFNNPPLPTRTEADVKTVPGLGGMGSWAAGFGSGNCMGPAESRQGGGQAVWLGFGGGGQYGQANQNLDWGCVVGRDMSAAARACELKVMPACADLGRMYEMLPSVQALRTGSLPDYAKGQMPAPKPAAPAPRAEAPAVKTVAVQQPKGCLDDSFIAARMGMEVCK